MEVERVPADGHDQDYGESEHGGGELVNLARHRLLRDRSLLDAREIQEMVVGGPLLRIVQDFVRANDLPEAQRRLRIARIDVGMAPLDGSAKRRSQTLSVVVRKSSEQIVKRLHTRTRGPTLSHPV